MRRADQSTARWIGGGIALALIVAGVAVFVATRPPPRPAAPPPPVTPRPAPSNPDRIVASEGDPLHLDGAPMPVLSLLNVPGPMRYGQSIWDESGVPAGPVWIRVDRQAQMISVFRGGHEIGTAVIVYGAPQKPTPAGTYPILAKMREHRSSLYNADMPFTLRLTGDGVAIHAASVREGRATHGCIGIPPDFAEKLFERARQGDPVLIV